MEARVRNWDKPRSPAGDVCQAPDRDDPFPPAQEEAPTLLLGSLADLLGSFHSIMRSSSQPNEKSPVSAIRQNCTAIIPYSVQRPPRDLPYVL